MFSEINLTLLIIIKCQQIYCSYLLFTSFNSETQNKYNKGNQSGSILVYVQKIEVLFGKTAIKIFIWWFLPALLVMQSLKCLVLKRLAEYSDLVMPF